MESLHNPVRDYAWGSRETIAALQRRPVPSPTPEAELWMGAHPDDPSRIERAGGVVTLAEAIEADPAGMLGGPTVAAFGPRLPFLLKLLAAEQPLSLQAHPDPEQARAGYAAEAGLPADAPERNYRDPYAKPEMLVAASDFLALCGFRDPAASAKLLTDLGVPALRPVVDRLAAGEAATALREAVATLLGWPEDGRAELVGAVARAAAARTGHQQFGAEYGVAAELAGRYPDDVGVVVALLLNLVRLRPGEAIWMPAGNLHSYLSGTGVEVLAASDNVLRGGLTPKRADVAELLRVLRYEVLPDPVVRPRTLAPTVPGRGAAPDAPSRNGRTGLVTWDVPAREFTLARAELAGDAPVELPAAGPRILFCLSGRVWVDDGTGRPQELAGGASAFVPGTAGPVRCQGGGVLFQAGVPLG